MLWQGDKDKKIMQGTLLVFKTKVHIIWMISCSFIEDKKKQKKLID